MESRGNEARIEWNEHPIVRVEATVMARGELGWTPYLGAGHSKVAIYESTVRTHYRIYGYKIHDRKVTLDSLIPPRMLFVKASDIFHHWTIGDQRMGLAFHGTVDARSFDRGIRVALENLEKAYQGTSSGSSTCSRTSDEPHSASPTSNHSFSLPSSDDTSRAKPQPSSMTSSLRQPVPRQITTLKLPRSTAPFRQQTLSASSSWQRPAPPRVQRRHSSSVPGHAQRNLSVTSPPIGQTTPRDYPRSPVTCTPPSTPELPVKDLDDHMKESPKTQPPTLKESDAPVDVFSSSAQRRHRHRHHRHQSRSRKTKTPNLDHLERQRDLQPTKPNSYVQFASARSSAWRSGSGVPMNEISVRPNDELCVKYHTSRYASQRIVPGGMYDCRYQGLKTNDDFHSDFYPKPPYHTSPSFSSYSDPSGVLKKKTLLIDHGKYKEDLAERTRCRHCQTMFNIDRNRPGDCPDAPPDSGQTCIERASCLCLAHSVLYNCFRDSEGNYEHEPCSCSRHYNGRSSRRKWLVLAALSVLVPCLCLYPVLKSCHKCGVACHYCGGRHEPLPVNRNSPNHPSKRR
ncbi:sprouty-related, EVH1 domain-containing protein 2-like [Clavelina lepadiformis]|uniref:sprouty-related, EVH1 domain-containing protein 2-like n=1 Tax=Clavelina lepadiformis TaxID=159417 RepID=UPI0040417CA6